ncbi:hypothetical protein [Umezawaea beigongshangensis]|uniref:hypothetical protein n=1 Tax=Umezawaea beigongshangensis TaxID=2780383 RepID=UPI0018F17066|nr:hypothetical protein [Umezawaea beigongshangensis]
MALARRVAAVLPLAGAVATAVALTGAAVFTVAHAGCAESGYFEQRDGVVEFVGGCVDGTNLPAVPPRVGNVGYDVPVDGRQLQP